MFRLDGRTALVTGAGGGIGAEVAMLMAELGANVVVNDLGVTLAGEPQANNRAETVAEKIRAAGGNAVADSGDVSDHQSAEHMVDLAFETFGNLDILVNTAGNLRDRMIFNMAEEEWDAVIQVHLKGTFNTCKHASARWRTQRDPDAQNRIINFTSRSGLLGAPAQPNYAAAKLGIVGLTFSLANSLVRYGVTANAVAPNALTRMADSVPQDRRRLSGDDDADNELSPRNVAPLVAYLAGPDSGWCNGQVLGVTGYAVSLYNNPDIAREIVGTSPWDMDHLQERIEASFRPVCAFNPISVLRSK